MQNEILFIIDKIELKYFEFNNLVTNFWLIKQLLKENQNVYITTIDKLSLQNSKPVCKCSRAFIKDENIFYEKEFLSKKIDFFQLVMFRPDPPVDLDYINATYVLDFVNKDKTLILNDTKAIRDFNEKMHANHFVEFMPENIVSADKEEILAFLERNEEIILKPLNACFGSGVMFLKKNDKNTNAIIKSMTSNGQTLIMVQKYISNAMFGDKRVLILNGEVLDECVVKLPSKDDFKFNTHSDEFIKKATLTDSEKTKFKTVAQKLQSLGIIMAGLDVIDEQIIEVNVTSPCFFIKEINNYFSTSLEKKITHCVLELLNKKIKNKSYTVK